MTTQSEFYLEWNADRVRKLVRKALQERADTSGAVLYSGIDTLKPGKFYMMGYNPGGVPQQVPTPLIETIQDCVAWSAYTHECWKCDTPQCEHIDENTLRLKPEHLLRHQVNVAHLTEVLGVTPESIFATNAIFARSERASTLDYANEWWDACWKAHQEFLAVVRPSWIITLGKGMKQSAFALLMHKMGVSDGKVEWTNSENRRSDGRWFAGRINLGTTGDDLNVKVLGVPHPSYLQISERLNNFIKVNLVNSA